MVKVQANKLLNIATHSDYEYLKTWNIRPIWSFFQFLAWTDFCIAKYQFSFWSLRLAFCFKEWQVKLMKYVLFNSQCWFKLQHVLNFKCCSCKIWNFNYINCKNISVNNQCCQKTWITEKLGIWQFMLKKSIKTLNSRVFEQN